MDGSPMPGAGPTDEIDALRRKLAFYEGFDAIIQDNVRRSGELLREAEERHAAAVGAARDAELRLDAERGRHREALAGVSTGLAEIAGRLADLSRRVDAALAGARGGDVGPTDFTIGPGPATLVVQGLADVADAQAVRAAVAALPGIRSAEPREFAAGLLRLDLETARAVSSSELVAAAMPMPLAAVDGGGSVIVLRRNGSAG